MITVEPLNSVAGVAFGATRASVRAMLGSDFREFKKSKFSANTSDDYGFAHIFYDANNALVAIELFDDCTVSVDDDCLMPCDQQSFVAWLKSRDPAAEIGDADTTSVKLSIGASFANGNVESILFAKAGYYA